MNKDYSILDEVKTIADCHVIAKPDCILVTDSTWEVASPETRELLLQIEHVEKPLEDAYFEAVKGQDWKRALLTYQRLTGIPYLFSIDPELQGETECIKREIEFVAKTKEWLTEAVILLEQ